MRPQSEIRCDIAAALMDGPGTTKQLAQRTGWSIGMTRAALNNMVTAGDACKHGSVRVAGVKRPVPVYARAMRDEDVAFHGAEPLAAVLSAWKRWPDYVAGSQA